MTSSDLRKNYRGMVYLWYWVVARVAMVGTEGALGHDFLVLGVRLNNYIGVDVYLYHFLLEASSV